MAGFGPNSEVVHSFLERIRFLDEGEALALEAAWRSADESRRRLARRAVRSAARRAGRRMALQTAYSSVVDWANSRAPFLAPGPVIAGGWTRGDIARRALPALTDAVSALVVGGLISGDDFEALHGPFRSIDGPDQ